MTIRLASRSDASLILTLIRELAAYERLAHEVVATEDALAKTLFGPQPQAYVLIAETDGEPAGFALFFHNYSTFLGRPGIYLEDLFVLPDFRSQGIGGALLAALARLAVERGCGRLEWSVLGWNEPAIGFYQRMGATVMDEWRICRLTGEALVKVAGS